MRSAGLIRSRIGQVTRQTCTCRTFVSRTIGPSSTRHRVAAANARAAEHRRQSEQPTPIPTHSHQDTETQTITQQPDAQPDTVANKQHDFDVRSSDLLHQIHKGLVDMKEVNSPFDLKLNTHPGHSNKSLTLQLDPSTGSYEIKADSIARRITLFSPVSGIYHYEWDTVFEQWTSQTDQHFLLELLVRELLKVCRGVPKI